MDKKVEQVLYSIGLMPNYKGYQQLVQALKIAAEKPESLTIVTKWLYPVVARKCGTNWQAVERNIRTMLKIAWRTNPEKLEEWVGYPLEQKPKPAQFLALLVYQVSHT